MIKKSFFKGFFSLQKILVLFYRKFNNFTLNNFKQHFKT